MRQDRILVHSDYIAYDGAKQVLLKTLPLSDEYIALPGEHEKGLLEIAISPDGTQVASAGKAGVVLLLSFGEEPKTLLGHSDEIWGLDFSPDGALLASGSLDKAVNVWAVASGYKPFAITIGYRALPAPPMVRRFIAAGDLRCGMFRIFKDLSSPAGHAGVVKDRT